MIPLSAKVPDNMRVSKEKGVVGNPRERPVNTDKCCALQNRTRDGREATDFYPVAADYWAKVRPVRMRWSFEGEESAGLTLEGGKWGHRLNPSVQEERQDIDQKENSGVPW